MTWSVVRPFLLFLPLIICVLLHGFLSAGFLLRTRQSILRIFVYLLSCLFLVAYFLVFNQNLILATTKVQIDFPNRYLKIEDYYGIVRIPAEKIQAVAIEGGLTPSTIWLQSEQLTFCLDHRFPRIAEFMPLLSSIVSFEAGGAEYGYTIYRANNYQDSLNFDNSRNMLSGGVRYFLPWLCLFPFLAYPLAARAWQGKWRYFQILGISYYLPTLIICLITQPGLPLAVFLLGYPCYPLYLSAMCLPDNDQPKDK